MRGCGTESARSLPAWLMCDLLHLHFLLTLHDFDISLACQQFVLLGDARDDIAIEERLGGLIDAGEMNQLNIEEFDSELVEHTVGSLCHRARRGGVVLQEIAGMEEERRAKQRKKRGERQ